MSMGFSSGIVTVAPASAVMAGVAMPGPRAAGFTLVEILVVLGLTAVAATLAAPTFRELGANVRRDALVEELRAALLLARTEAVTRGVPIVVCPSADGRSCRPDPVWSHGWLVQPRSGPGDRSPAALAGTRHHAPPTVYATRAAVEFQPTATAATTATLTVCDWRGSDAARAVIVSRTGRVRVARGAEARCG